MTSLKIKGHVLTPSSGEEYIKAIQRVSELSVLHPKYVVFPTVFEDIPHIIKFATSQSLEIAVKGGGANTSAWSSTEGGLVIDLGKLKAVQVSDDKKTMTVQGGALWGDVYEVCKKAEIDVVGAPYWFLGVGGFLLGGGFGVMSGEHGFAVDSILGATVVLADGRIIKTSATEEPDLFWAIRGTVFANVIFRIVGSFFSCRWSESVWNSRGICPQGLSTPGTFLYWKLGVFGK